MHDEQFRKESALRIYVELIKGDDSKEELEEAAIQAHRAAIILDEMRPEKLVTLREYRNRVAAHRRKKWDQQIAREDTAWKKNVEAPPIEGRSLSEDVRKAISQIPAHQPNDIALNVSF